MNGLLHCETGFNRGLVVLRKNSAVFQKSIIQMHYPCCNTHSMGLIE